MIGEGSKAQGNPRFLAQKSKALRARKTLFFPAPGIEGSPAPDFMLKDKDGKQYSLKDITTTYAVLYFYPKDNTPGCTIEALEFNKALSVLHKLGVSVVGVSGGNEKSKKSFCEKHGLNLLLLSDSDFSASAKYGVYGEKKFMGRAYKGISRVTFILDKDRKILKVFDKVNPATHAAEVIDFLKIGVLKDRVGKK
ncbi:thioredoxin-dependent thiol peroxidase [Candidatus Woesearchaeota archaeon]|nr:thioredoxin-dependent thiol peroxidase [Candidatus Woesearchaeota archaeon]